MGSVSTFAKVRLLLAPLIFSSALCIFVYIIINPRRGIQALKSDPTAVGRHYGDPESKAGLDFGKGQAPKTPERSIAGRRS